MILRLKISDLANLYLVCFTINKNTRQPNVVNSDLVQGKDCMDPNSCI